MDPKDLDLSGVIAFDGVTRNGLRLHPDQENLIYPMGNKIVIRNIKSAEQTFLTGHKNIVTCVCVSSCGSFVASGQLNHYGFKAPVIIWDYKERQMKSSYEIHKVRVEDVCFSCDGAYLMSLGGRDDGYLVVWDVEKDVALCGSYASNEITGDAYTLCPTRCHPRYFLTAGDGTFKIWNIQERQKLVNADVKVGKLRRVINCLSVDEKDEYVYCGTTTGDVIKAKLYFDEDPDSVKASIMIGCYSKIPSRSKKPGSRGEGDLYAAGVRSIVLLPSQKLIIGGGDGTVELVEIADHLLKTPNIAKLGTQPLIATRRAVNVCSGVTSINLYKERHMFVGTTLCEIYEIDTLSFNVRTIVTCHTDSIRDIAFPPNVSDIFVTASKNDIRLWKLDTRRELLRIGIPNFVCTNVCFDSAGQLIISSWNDSVIRGFALAGGRLVFEIHNAHAKAVSAIALTNDDTRLFSGGCDGQIRMWDAKSQSRRLLGAMKEHRAPITCLRVSPNDKYLVSSSTDGTCVLWNAMTLTRKHTLMGNTMFMAAAFLPNGVQVLTCGTDRNIAYWETLDGSQVREIEGSSNTLNCIDISPDGQYFLTGSNDCLIKLWDYHTATVLRVGLAHAAPITACTFSPDRKYIVTVSADGAIMIWLFPVDLDAVGVDGLDKPEEVPVKRSNTSAPKELEAAPPAAEAAKEPEADRKSEASVCCSVKGSRRSSCASENGSTRTPQYSVAKAPVRTPSKTSVHCRCEGKNAANPEKCECPRKANCPRLEK